MPRKISVLGAAIWFSVMIAFGEGAQAATGGVPMTASDPPHPWFDWIFFAVVVPWLVLAVWEYFKLRD